MPTTKASVTEGDVVVSNLAATNVECAYPNTELQDSSVMVPKLSATNVECAYPNAELHEATALGSTIESIAEVSYSGLSNIDEFNIVDWSYMNSNLSELKDVQFNIDYNAVYTNLENTDVVYDRYANMDADASACSNVSKFFNSKLCLTKVNDITQTFLEVNMTG